MSKFKTLYLTEMPHISFGNVHKDFYMEKDPRWIITKFLSFANKYKGEKQFILSIENQFFKLIFNKFFNKLSKDDKSLIIKKLDQKVKSILDI